MATYAYTRVSTADQTVSNQVMEIQAKINKDINRFFSDTGVSGTTEAKSRPAFKEMLEVIKEGDTLVVVKLDRLGRNARDILNTVNILIEKGVDLRILQLGTESLQSPMGKAYMTMMALFAEMERDILVERVTAGLARAKAEGKIVGKSLIHPTVVRQIMELQKEGMSTVKISSKLDVSIPTVNQYKNYTEDQFLEHVEKYEARLKQLKKKKK